MENKEKVRRKRQQAKQMHVRKEKVETRILDSHFVAGIE